MEEKSLHTTLKKEMDDPLIQAADYDETPISAKAHK